MPTFTDRLAHAWNAFMNRDPTVYRGNASYTRPDRVRLTRGNERSIVNAVFNRIAADCAAVDVQHVRLDQNDRYTETIDDNFNQCLMVSANIDQSGRAFRQDIFMSMLDEGVVAVVPIDTTLNPRTHSFDILSMRTGKIVEWYPEHVKVKVYNQRTGQKEEIVVPKSSTAIIENPFYSIMNEPNSVAQRLIRKLNILDVIDEQSGSGKLDMIIQLPYTIKSPARKQQAEERRQSIENQLTGSKYGIAYIDATEHVTQLNRAVENNLMNQIEFLTSMLYSQLGITKEILDNSATEEVMNNYSNRTLEPILSAVCEEMRRKFLTKTARTQKQSVMFFKKPFKFVSATNMAEIADKMTRNEIMTSNEVRQELGMKPSEDPRADQLVNKNISQSKEMLEDAEAVGLDEENEEMTEEEYMKHKADLDKFDAELDELEKMANE
ncbi:MAG: phage portal protein [Pseudobutyrivibrio sp.]|nr:phage portal protein [Pseudobutyrivibrio sp.]